MAAITVGFCTFPLFNFAFSLPPFSLQLPLLPDLGIDLDLTCPLND